MAKRKTASQLGVPKGFKLTVATKDNLVKSATFIKFGEEIIKLAKQESELIHELSEEMCPETSRRKLINSISDWASVDVAYSVLFKRSTQLKVQGVFSIGNGAYYVSPNDKVKMGILGKALFMNYVNDINNPSELGLTLKPENSYDSIYNRWVKEFNVVHIPVVFDDKRISDKAYKNVTKKTKMKLQKHLKKCEELYKAVEKFQSTLKIILTQYSSVIKLATDVPETVEWMNKAVTYNAKGYKCSDVSVHDSIQELKKL